MKSGCAPAQQLLGHLSTDLDPDPPDLIIIVCDLIDPLCHRRGQRGTGQLSEPGHLAHVGDRHDPRNDRDLAAECPYPGYQREVVVSGEEQLGDRETCSSLRLGHKHPCIKIKIFPLRMRVGEGRHADAELPQLMCPRVWPGV